MAEDPPVPMEAGGKGKRRAKPRKDQARIAQERSKAGVPAQSPSGESTFPAKLRLATKGRLVLCGMPAILRERLREGRWILAGELLQGDICVILPVVEDGYSLSKDGRLFFHGVSGHMRPAEELDLWVTDHGSHFVCNVKGREAPDPMKVVHLMESATRKHKARNDPNAMYLFDELKP